MTTHLLALLPILAVATHTFITVLAWVFAIYGGICITAKFWTFFTLRLNARGWFVLIGFILSLWWILCN